MKKIISFICALLLCVSPLLLVSCKKPEKEIDPSFYLEEKAYYTVYNKSGNIDDKYSSFTDDKFDNMTQYLSVGFTGNSANLYKMTLKTITFEVFANQDTELQFDIRISNLRNSDIDGNGKAKFTAHVDAKNGKAVKVTVPIGDYFESNSSTISIVIELDSSMYYYADGEETNLKIDISNFKMFGSHNIKNAQ